LDHRRPNGELFTITAEQALTPLGTGDIILDNLGSHKGQAAPTTVRTKGAHLIFLPDFNPIDFAKLKPPLRCRAMSCNLAQARRTTISIK
jgi:hypothetical protein